MRPDKTFQFGAAISGTLMLISESLDSIRDTDYVASVLGSYNCKRKDPWLAHIYEDWSIVCVAYSEAFNLRCILSKEGEINLYGQGGNPDRSYQLPDAGVFREGAGDFGYVNRIRAIGSSIYVCGQHRQVYRFFPGASNVLEGHWEDFAGPMRQPPRSKPPAKSEGEEEFVRWLDENRSIVFWDIAGSDEDDIYVAGDECWHYDGKGWKQLQLPTTEFIYAIKVISRDQVVMGGHNGTLLQGNARQGFIDLSSVEDNQSFVSVELFEDKLFLASNMGLFTYDPRSKKIERYITDLSPDLQDTHILEAKDGILWSFGYKDLAYFDGKRWTRIDHPDNPPIR